MNKDLLSKELRRAWGWREQRGLMSVSGTPLRVFYGPGEGEAGRSLAIDRFGDHYWVTWWQKPGDDPAATPPFASTVTEFLGSNNAASAVLLSRPVKGTPELPSVLFGSAPEQPVVVREGETRFAVRMLGGRHPGLFLDHAPLRSWLTGHASGWKVLNTFAYTGSLSIASAVGGAREVTTLDLSGSTVQWAEENWKLNSLSSERGKFIAGDVFEWLPRFARKNERFDCVILDPPSFSRGKKGNFSVVKDLKRLHELAMALLEPGGILITSTNSEELPQQRFEAEVQAAARSCGQAFEVLGRIDLPETFPTRLEAPEERYLKGLILRRR